MPNRHPYSLLPFLAAASVPARPSRRLSQSRSAPRPPGPLEAPSARDKRFPHIPRRNPNYDYPQEPQLLPYLAQAEHERFERRPLTEQMDAVVQRNGRTYYDPGRRIAPAVEQAERLRRQFARTRGLPGVDERLQARVVDAADAPEALALLDVIGFAEGGDTWRDRGGAQWNSRFDDRPDRRLTFEYNRYPEAGPGRFQGDHQTAAGRYQIQRPLYGDFAPQLGLSDFYPLSQNAIALGTMAERRGMLDSLGRGDMEQLFFDLARYWASVPQGPSAGANRDVGRYARMGQRAPFTYDDLLAYYKQRLIHYEGGAPRGRVIEGPLAPSR